jgi:transcriptional regulator with XRE-family HTH domain
MQQTFATQLKNALKAQDVSIYALARRIDPDHPERAERNIYRWLSGTTARPSRMSRCAVADALELPRDTFGSDEDEDESVPVLLRKLAEQFEKALA